MNTIKVLARLIPVRRGAGLVLVAMVVALLEHIPFWNNSLSFSNLFIPDKKNAYYYLTDSNIDWGQNYSRVMTRVREDYPDAAFNPPHILPGQNVIRLNYLAGVFRNFEQHRWVRTHLRPSAHVLHTHLVYEVSDDQFAAFLAHEQTAETVSDPASCPTVVAALPLTQVADSPATQVLCFENMNNRIKFELAGGSGMLGKVSTGGGCEGLALGNGQYGVYQVTAPYSRLCLASHEPNTRWVISEFRPGE
ncbi:MAG: hypothetical protein RLZZ385_683 [Pseudomonadota bacterium]|jgi:hypothetical protein